MIARSDGVAKRDCIQQPSQIWERWMPKAELRWGCPELDRLSYRTKMCDSSTVALIFEVGQKWKSRRGGSSPGLLLKNEYKLNFRSKMSQSQSQRWIGLPKKTNSSVTPKIRPHAPGKCSCKPINNREAFDACIWMQLTERNVRPDIYESLK